MSVRRQNANRTETRASGPSAIMSVPIAIIMEDGPVMRQPRILMCPPDYYGIEYEINPWMSRSRGSERGQARAQWESLYETLRRLGVQVDLLQPQPGLPDLVFTANAGLMFKNRFYSSRFRHEVRARESPHFDAWFAAHGLEVVHFPEN